MRLNNKDQFHKKNDTFFIDAELDNCDIIIMDGGSKSKKKENLERYIQ